MQRRLIDGRLDDFCPYELTHVSVQTYNGLANQEDGPIESDEDDHEQQPSAEDATGESGTPGDDPRAMLATWANSTDEWARHVVRHVLSTSRGLSPERIDAAHQLFRQEKALDERSLPVESPLAVAASAAEVEEPLSLTKISEVVGVNALAPGAVIDPHEGLTVLFGENGTGKTGYARILKALANSRTADVILGDIENESDQAQSAKIGYLLGATPSEFEWHGEIGDAPFTRISIFDSPAVTFHVDEDLDYVYTPTSLALFDHVNAGIRAVQGRTNDTLGDLGSRTQGLLSRFPRDSTIYPIIETLGAATDLDSLRQRADTAPNAEERLGQQQRAVAALESNTIENQLALNQRQELVLNQAVVGLSLVERFDSARYDALRGQAESLRGDYRTFRTELFAAAGLPAEPEETWAEFIQSGEAYRQHLEVEGRHDATVCLYCRQSLDADATALVNKYRDYLADKIASDLADRTAELDQLVAPPLSASMSDVTSFLAEHKNDEAPIQAVLTLRQVQELIDGFREPVSARSPLADAIKHQATPLLSSLRGAHSAVAQTIAEQRAQVSNRTEALTTERRKLIELTAAIELGRSWPQVETQVAEAKEADRLRILMRAFPTLQRQVTELSKAASDRLINQSFDTLFAEECEMLRAPALKVQFVGRQGKAQRRKVLRGKYKPSKVLSEGEQKVLAIADFLAEARLTGITATVVFDDPVSSLDHRRIDEVAERIGALAGKCQVIVFTHDILFTTKLLSLFETSKRCTYYQVTDDPGKGHITHASGPRWDTLKNLKGRVAQAIADAKDAEGETRHALVRTGYDWLRSYLEVFTEAELLQNVTQRYQPNVKMTSLENIKVGALSDAIAAVIEIFERACRYIDGHSQPLPALGVSPTLKGLEEDWEAALDARKRYLEAD